MHTHIWKNLKQAASDVSSEHSLQQATLLPDTP